MSKKDLLERLTRAPSETPVRPRREDEVVAGRPAAEAAQTRVNTRVVRRRTSPADETPVAPVVRRRTAVVVDEERPRQVADARQPAPEQGSAPAREPEAPARTVIRRAAPTAPEAAPTPQVDPTRADAARADAAGPDTARADSARTDAAGASGSEAPRSVDSGPAEPSRTAEPSRADESSRSAEPAREAAEPSRSTEPAREAAEPARSETAPAERAPAETARVEASAPAPERRPEAAPERRPETTQDRRTDGGQDRRPDAGQDRRPDAGPDRRPDAGQRDTRPQTGRREVPPGRDNGREPEAVRADGAQRPPPDGSPTNQEAPGARTMPKSPRFVGLGSAVVSPPPGYDPTNPEAFRRKQEAARAATNTPDNRRPGGPGRRQVHAPAAPERPAPAEFRPANEGPSGPARRRRGGPQQRMMERPRPKGRRKASGPKASSPAPKAAKRKIKVDNTISVGQLAHELGVKASVVIKQLMGLGVMASITQMLDPDTATLVAAEFDYEVENVGFQEHNYLESVPEAVEEEGVISRPPVVTIMGHVDHGKTTLLDSIRKARVAAGEAGGITQHIGAYQVATTSGVVTFIDTPGHAAFTAMRARGAQVTDIVVLVVAADDGVQPQTVEAIQHARAAKVPIVVAVNKMDKAGVTMDPIMTRLSEQGLLAEQWGGDTMYVPVSALRGEGIDALLEAILLQAEVLDLKANPDRFAEGVVLEAKMERGRGAVATVLVQKGTLKRGDHVVLGSAYGKVRAIVGGLGENLKEAGPSTPVELFGLSELPEVGDSVHTVKSEQNARALAEHRSNTKREGAMSGVRRRTAEDLFASANAPDRVVFHIILKADVGGSLQALRTAIEGITVAGADCQILQSAVGDVTESDVNLAAANGAKIIGFNVKLDAKARQAAAQLGVEPEFYSIIYEVLDRVTRGLKGMLAPVYEQVRVGTVEVRQLFKISKTGTVAGSYVLDGKIQRSNTAKVLRDGKLLWEGKVHSIRRFKDDVREVTAGHECGVSLDGFEALEAGDLIEAYAEQVVENT